MTESERERTDPENENADVVGEHDADDERGGGGPGGLSGAVPGVKEKPTPEGETSINEEGGHSDV